MKEEAKEVRDEGFDRRVDDLDVRGSRGPECGLHLLEPVAMSGWREVCRWDVEPSMAPLEYGEQVSLAESLMEAGKIGLRYHQAFENMAACYEELAGEHRELTSQHKQAIEVLNALRVPDPAQVPEGQVSVRPYVRAKPRRSRPVEIGADHPTVQAAPGEGQSGASGEDTGLVQIVGTCEIHGPPSVVGEVCYPDAIPAQPEERSE